VKVFSSHAALYSGCMTAVGIALVERRHIDLGRVSTMSCQAC